MKHTLFKLVLLLVVGAIINVAVAWGFGATFDDRTLCTPISDVDFAENASWWRAHAPLNFPIHATEGGSLTNFGREVVALSAPTTDVFHNKFFVWRIRSGWPSKSMEWSHWMNLSDRSEIRKGVLTDQVWEQQFRGIPYHVTASGFAINTIFYAAIVWLLFAAPFKLRRWRRIKRGLCPACAYPVGTSSTCTECGKPVTVGNAGQPPYYPERSTSTP